MKRQPININCDLGEGVAVEPELFPYLYSCSVACGGHFGNRDTIIATLTNAQKYRVKVGAHPSYPDRENFGRRSMLLPKAVFQESIREQLRGYFSCLEDVGLSNFHIKAHGALYNDLAMNEVLTGWYLEALKDFDHGYLYAPFGSVIAKKAKAAGWELLYEAFLDRNYMPDGRLVPRNDPMALKTNPEEVWRQLKTFLLHEGVEAVDGQWVPMPANTFCLHGDHPQVVEFLKAIDKGIKQRLR